ncbi:MAG: DUF3047 domain-containing protein [Rhodospirillales bacterium]
MMIGKIKRELLTAFLALSVVAACTGPTTEQRILSATEEVSINGLQPESVFNAGSALFEAWTPINIRGKGDWQLLSDSSSSDLTMQKFIIRGEAKESASGIILETSIDPEACPVLEWRWLVEAVQQSADLRLKDKDDVAAALILMFGDPGMMSQPRPVPTLRYVWTGGGHERNAVIANPYLPETVRNIVIRNREDPTNAWLSERRNVLQDYEAAFGNAPDYFVWAVALFIDNDQTKEDAAAQFTKADSFCR